MVIGVRRPLVAAIYKTPRSHRPPPEGQTGSPPGKDRTPLRQRLATLLRAVVARLLGRKP
jgi:hypothetical protein